MTSLLNSFVTKRRHLIVEENDVMTVLKVLNEVKSNSKIHILMSMEVGNCGWTDDPTKWFIHFDATNKQWSSVITKINEANRKIVLRKDDRLYLD